MSSVHMGCLSQFHRLLRGRIRLISRDTDQQRNNSFASYPSQSKVVGLLRRFSGRRRNKDASTIHTSCNMLFRMRTRETTFALHRIRYRKGNSPAQGGSTRRRPVWPISCRAALSPSGESDAHQRRYAVVLHQGSYPTRRSLSGLPCRVVSCPWMDEALIRSLCPSPTRRQVAGRRPRDSRRSWTCL